jgi:hypothetical protein
MTVLCVWGFFDSHPNGIGIWFLLVFPLYILTLPFKFPKFIEFDMKDEGKKSSVILLFFLPSTTLFLKSFYPYQFVSSEGFWFPFSIISAILIALHFVQYKEVRQKASNIIPVLFICTSYSSGLILTINAKFEVPNSRTIQVQTLKKVFRDGPGRSPDRFVLKIKTAPQHSSIDEVEVSESYYNSVDVGHQFNIRTRKGYFGIQWLEQEIF